MVQNKNSYLVIAVLTVLALIIYFMSVKETFEVPQIPKLPGTQLDEQDESVNIEPVPVQLKAKEYPKNPKNNNFNVLQFEKTDGSGQYKKQFNQKLDILADVPCKISCPMSDYTCDTGNVCLTKKEKKIFNKRAQNRTVEY